MEAILVASTAFYPARGDVAWAGWDTGATSQRTLSPSSRGGCATSPGTDPTRQPVPTRATFANILEQHHHSVPEHAGFRAGWACPAHDSTQRALRPQDTGRRQSRQAEREVSLPAGKRADRTGGAQTRRTGDSACEGSGRHATAVDDGR